MSTSKTASLFRFVPALAGLALIAAGCGQAAPAASPSAGAAKPAAETSAAPSAAASAKPATSASAAAKPSGGAAQVVTVKMGQTGNSPASWPLFVGQAKGFLEKQGLKVENVVIGSSVTQTQALINGDVSFNTYSVDSMAKPILQGATIKLIGSAQEVPNFQMIVSPSINSWADLKGKTVAAGSAGGYFDIVMRGMMEANGLKANDYQVISIGDSSQRLPAIQTNKVAGAIMGGPDDSRALAAGLKSLGYVNQYLKDIQYNGYGVEDKWAKSHEALVVGFLKAMKQSTDWLYDPANKAEAESVYNAVSPLEPKYLDAIYDQLITQKMLSRDLKPNNKGIENLLNLAVNQKNLDKVPPLDSWIDLSYLNKALAG